MLCDFAEVCGGKLFVSGAGLALLASPSQTPPYRINVSLAILGLINLADTDAQHKLTIELVRVTGSGDTRVTLSDDLPEGADPRDRGTILIYFMAPRSPEMMPGDEWSMPMAVPLYGLGLPDLGSYYFSVRIDGREMDRSSFRIVSGQQLAGRQPDGGGARGGGTGPSGAGRPREPGAGPPVPDLGV